MTFLEECIQDSLPIWEACLETEFLKGVADGSLPEDCFMGYIVDEKLKKEAIQLVVHFTDEYMESIHGDMDAAYKHISSIVDDVNRTLLTYKKISKIVISEKPLPMTSSSKVKRSEAKLLFKDK